MGYFANGTEGEIYEEEYCLKCRHQKEDEYCAVMDAHQLYNYAECNNRNSILHILIPRDIQGYNEKCRMFLAKQTRVPVRKQRINQGVLS
jgi:hypothetical protein